MGQKRKAGQRVSKSNVQRKLCSARLNPVTSFIRTALPAGILFGLHIGVAVAGPEGGVVAAGQANISTPNATTTVVNQASQNAVVNWESFNVKTNEAVNFNQPNAQAQILNRIYASIVNSMNGVVEGLSDCGIKNKDFLDFLINKLMTEDRSRINIDSDVAENDMVNNVS